MEAAMPAAGIHDESAGPARPSSPSTDASNTEEDEMTVKAGSRVSIEYTLTLEDGSTADSNVGGEPLVYTQGSQQILPALETAIEGMAVEESKKVELPPEQGYGAKDPEAFQEVETQQVPENAREEGAMLVARDSSGGQRPVRVSEVRGETTVIDLNHPLAGETLYFDVKILGID
jgi:FKBP-type peptidyl-prolyl cis-trans isomerase SlyD